ncbi:MAG TPA: hypothetical protein VF450_16940 [Noviherbaspirillum sp.]
MNRYSIEVSGFTEDEPAAATLADQSHRLSDAISVFRLRRSERGARGAIDPAPAF